MEPGSLGLAIMQDQRRASTRLSLVHQQNTVATNVAETRIELASTGYEPVGVPFPHSAINGLTLQG